MAKLRIERLRKVFAGSFVAVDDLSLDVADGEFLVLLGPSGCGKTTTLHIVAGLEEATSGSIYFDDVRIDDLPTHHRDIAMVFQSYALYPHMSVFDNIGFGLRMRGTPRDEIRRRVHEVAELLDISQYLDRRPAQLSGGQRQRVALGRSIVRNPKVFLLDEPLSNIDAKLRAQMRLELKALHRRLGATFVYVTHDQVEAMSLGDRIAIMHEGNLLQCDTPAVVFDRPADLHVATFLGSPPMNLFQGTIAADRPGVFECPQFDFGLPPAMMAPEGTRCVLGIRPTDIDVVDPLTPGTIQGVVEFDELLGADRFVAVDVGGQRVQVRVAPKARLPEREIGLAFPLELLHLFDAETGLRIQDADAEASA